MENNENKFSDEDIDKALEKQYGIDAANREYASDASTEDNRTSFEIEKDEETNSKVVESKNQGNHVIIKNINEEENKKPEEKKKTPAYVIISFALSVLSFVTCLVFLVFQVIFYKNGISENLTTVFDVLRILAWVFFAISLVTSIVISFVVSKQKLLKYAIVLSIAGPILILVSEYILRSF